MIDSHGEVLPRADLMALLRDEDRVPRGVVNECARRGDEMVEALDELLPQDAFWQANIDAPQWWLRLHATMILGLIPGERAGTALVAFMRRASEARDENLEGWFGGYWPALFRNKPDSVVPALRAMASDRGLDWFARINAAEAVIAIAQRDGVGALDEALDWMRDIAADESGDWTMRLGAGNTLLDLPRERNRPLLEDLAARQKGVGVSFSPEEV